MASLKMTFKALICCSRDAWCFNKISGLVIKMSFLICYSHRIWAVFWRLRPPVLPQLQEAKGSQDWCHSPQGSLCPRCLLSPRHLALKFQVQILLSRIQVHMKSSTANVKVRESVWIVDFTGWIIDESKIVCFVLIWNGHSLMFAFCCRGVPFADGRGAVSGQ